MNSRGRTTLLIADTRHESDRRRADAWRRDHDRFEAVQRPVATSTSRRTVAAIVRLIPHHA